MDESFFTLSIRFFCIRDNSKYYFPCSDKYLSASIAALQPLPAAVIAWR